MSENPDGQGERLKSGFRILRAIHAFIDALTKKMVSPPRNIIVFQTARDAKTPAYDLEPLIRAAFASA